ncbi:F0F1 ATP synthase subunit epsilon [Maritalea mediterranea]|uniref:ATP synthase epsilon chain n=1 Tax=Maritalea mediterranea TaxID=2909667 RepID=A0ABS9EAV0_9HYPH|nr:F0F1 ATP synthase subunit epsilon [Maritalea mediterranea]MCF4100026.1 F0F1 ATP synthase subunit epsilon [Maritalea mediterranea]
MAEGIKIEVVSPENLVLSDDVASVTVPGTDGYFTVMGDHAAMMTTLKAGFVTVKAENGDVRSFYVRGGFADVSNSGLTILAEEAKTGEDFDRSEVDAAIVSAQKALEKAEDDHAKQEAQNNLDGWKNLLLEVDAGGMVH